MCFGKTQSLQILGQLPIETNCTADLWPIFKMPGQTLFRSFSRKDSLKTHSRSIEIWKIFCLNFHAFGKCARLVNKISARCDKRFYELYRPKRSKRFVERQRRLHFTFDVFIFEKFNDTLALDTTRNELTILVVRKQFYDLCYDIFSYFCFIVWVHIECR